MKDRIIQFLKENNLTSTKFADIIGVQRSSISHILSGRNKPSFDFIEKMLRAYPDLNAQWLITGKGNSSINQPSLFSSENRVENYNNLTSRESNIQNLAGNNTDLSKSGEENMIFDRIEEKIEAKPKNQSKIDRVMIFYSDGTFKEYKPG